MISLLISLLTSFPIDDSSMITWCIFSFAPVVFFYQVHFPLMESLFFMMRFILRYETSSSCLSIKMMVGTFSFWAMYLLKCSIASNSVLYAVTGVPLLEQYDFIKNLVFQLQIPCHCTT